MKTFIKSKFWLIIPLIASSGFFLYNLARLPLEDADEATYAMVLREMVEHGHYLTLTLFDKPWIEKPPLLFWAMAASSKIFGFNEFALRLPSAIFGVVAVAFASGILWEGTRKRETAFLGGMILAAMPLFLAAARNLRMDVPVTATVLAAVYFFLKGRTKPRYLLGVGASIGIGVLLKSVIAFLAIPAILMYSVIYREWRWMKNKYFWFGTIAGLAIAAPWHLYEMWFLGFRFANQYLGFHVLERISSDIIHSKITAGYLLWVFWNYGQPWGAVGLVALAVLLIFSFGKTKDPRNLKFVAFSLTTFIFTYTLFLLLGVRHLMQRIGIVYPYANNNTISAAHIHGA